MQRACVSDHCDAYRNAFKRGFPDAELLQCWPHISRKFQEGEYVSTTCMGALWRGQGRSLCAAPCEVSRNALLKKAGLMGNNRKAPVPALQREPQVEPDSSDEEAERLELLGQQGK